MRYNVSRYDVSWDDVSAELTKAAEPARRAARAVAGGGKVLLIAGPGSGKTTVARRLALDLPRKWVDQRISMREKIWRLSGLDLAALPFGTVPFRAPHHTASLLGMVGDGAKLQPGELSLAHGGVLFLDEAPEFRGGVLEAVAAAHREGVVHYRSGSHLASLPSEFLLVCAANPCPCGWHGSPSRTCLCSEAARKGYLKRLNVLAPDVLVTL